MMDAPVHAIDHQTDALAYLVASQPHAWRLVFQIDYVVFDRRLGSCQYRFVEVLGPVPENSPCPHRELKSGDPRDIWRIGFGNPFLMLSASNAKKRPPASTQACISRIPAR